MSSITQSYADHFSNSMASFHRRGYLGSAEIAEVFGRLINDSALDGDLTEALAERWGTQAGHYARLALAERENFDAGLHVIASAFPGGMVSKNIPAFNRVNTDHVERLNGGGR